MTEYLISLLLIASGSSSTAADLSILIFGGLVAIGIISAGVWLFARVHQHWETNPKGARLFFLCFALVYICSGVIGVVQVIRGRVALTNLIGFAVIFLMAWFYLRSAAKVKVPHA